MGVVITVLLCRVKSVLSSPLCKVSLVSNCSHGAVAIALPLLNLYGCVLQNSYSFPTQRRCQTFFVWSVWIFVLGFFESISCSFCMIESLVLDTSVVHYHVFTQHIFKRIKRCCFFKNMYIGNINFVLWLHYTVFSRIVSHLEIKEPVFQNWII